MDSSFESTLLCTQNQGQNFFVLWAHRRILKERELWVMLSLVFQFISLYLEVEYFMVFCFQAGLVQVLEVKPLFHFMKSHLVSWFILVFGCLANHRLSLS